MTMRLSIISLAGIARTLVAVGMSSDADMFLATAAAAPRSTCVSSPSAAATVEVGFFADAGAGFVSVFSGVFSGVFAEAALGLSALSALSGVATPPLLLAGFGAGAGAGSGGEVGVEAGLPLPLAAARPALLCATSFMGSGE